MIEKPLIMKYTDGKGSDKNGRDFISWKWCSG